MNCATPEAATTASGEQIGTVQDVKTAMFNEEESKLNSDEAKSTITEFFPWVSEFKKMCKCIYADKSMASLAELMQYYIRNMSISVNKCSIKPLKAVKLKDSISETLLLFLYMYRELSEDRNRSIYLNNMSDLLALYIDVELKASKKNNEDHNEICTRLTSCLYVYLEHSTEHLLDTLIKIQFMCRNYHHILDPIMTKVTKTIPAHPESNVMYVRYLLIYCLWRKINIDMIVRKDITTTAIASLGIPPATFPPYLLEDVLPKVPKCQPTSAKHLMHHKFNIRKCCELFIQFCRKNRGDIRQEKSENAITTTIPSSSKRPTSQLLEVTPRENENMNHIENKCNLISSDNNIESNRISSDNLKSSSLNKQISIKPLGTISTNISVTRTISKSIKPKVLSRKKSKSTKKIVLIDLTSDTVFERYIAKRKSRKVAWLEEAKKLNAKTIRASQKMKKQQVAENMNCSKNSTFEQRSEDLIQFTCATENAFSKNDLKSSATWDIKRDNDKIKSKKYFETEHTVSTKQSVDANSSDKNDIVIPCTLSSVIVNKPQSNKYKTSTNSLSNVTNNTDNVNKYHDVRDRINDETFNNRHTQTVIKRLIEQDAFPESETYKKNESLKKICDLETEHCKTVNTSLAICIQDNSKDEAYNASYLSTTKDKLSPSLIHMLWNNEKNGTIDEKADDIGDDERCAQEDTHNKSNEVRYSQSIRVDNELSENKLAISTAPETRIVTAISSTEVKSVNNMMESDQLQQLHIIKNIPKEVESQDEYVSVKKDIANNIINFNVTNGDHSNVQTDLHVDTCIEINDDVSNSKFSNRNIRENIFEDLTADKKTISNILDVSLCSSKEGATNENDIENMKIDCQKSPEIGSNRNCNKEYNIEKQRRYMLSAKVEKNSVERTFDCKLLRSPQKILHANIQDSLGNSCIIHDSELPGNIDGLSLLANVVTSQHGSHSKMEHELKIDQIKVKDYASLRSSPYNQNTDDETDTNDSLNAVSRIFENSTTEVVNRIVGIYPDDALGKVAHHIEVTSTTDMNHDGREHESSNNIPHIVHTSINYETDTVSNNINITESNVQSKENTNVILNGETVVLLQKSPNSNLYIINKAVENARDHNNGEDESCPVREKSWMIPPEDCASFEVVNASEHIPFNLEISQYNKDLTCQEKKFSISRTKGIKIEPEEETKLMTIAEMKSYSKKGSLSSEVISSATSPIYQDTNVANVSINKSTDKRKSKSILTYRQNIKQEFNNHVTPNCGIQGCNGIHSHSHEVIDSQHSLHIPVTHSTPISSIYGNCTAGTDLCMPYHKHCTSVSCSLKINSTASLHSHTKTVNSCGRSHCSCLDCRTYDIVTHCRQYIHPARDSHVSCIESNSYFLQPAHSSVQTSAVQEHDRTKSEAVISKLYDDQILCKIEQRVSLQKNNTLEKLDMQHEPEKLFKKDMDKLPLKKRLKAHAMMSMAYEELPIKTEKLDNYPGIPMMSIAALEQLDDAQKHSSQIIKSSYELSSNKEDRSHGYHFNSNIVRRDYYKDMHISNSRHNLTKESHERPFRPNGDQSSNAMCLQTSCQERTFKTPAQCRDMSVTNSTSLKRMEVDTMEQDNTCKKAKKTQSSIRQTRSSKRNVPKVNYCYTDVDPEWNPSGESKRRRKKTSR